MNPTSATERRYSSANEAIPNPPISTSPSIRKNPRPLSQFHHVSFYHGSKLLFRKAVNNMVKPTIKLKIASNSTTSANNTSIPPTPGTSIPSLPTPTQGTGHKIRLSFGGAKTPTIKTETPSENPPLPSAFSNVKTKVGRAPKLSAKVLANRKRTKEESDNDDDDDFEAKATKKITIDTSRTVSIPKKKLKFSISNAHQVSTPRTPVVVRAKYKGKPPKRPLGEGYDSEASDREEDPVIEEEWILRMIPGDDCDYLRTMISERKIGIPKAQGGADIYFKFFQSEGRRAAITIRGKCYAATMVDLPCVIEGMKSWDKKGWYKSADICQMLLVFAPIADEKEAETIELPKAVDPTTYQYPHGITAPMRNARKNRFRKRIRREAIEAVEDAVEKLLAADAEARDTRYEMIDPDAHSRHASYSSPAAYGEEDEEEYSNDEEMDAEGEVDDDMGYFNQSNIPSNNANSDALFDDIDLEAEFEREMMNDNDTSGVASPSLSTPYPTTDTPNAISDLNPHSTTHTQPTGSDEDEEDEDEESDSGSSSGESDIDEDTRARNAELAAAKEDIAEMERQLDGLQKQLSAQSNPILKARVRNNIEKVKVELALRRSAIGIGDGDEDEEVEDGGG